jgi:ABC-type sulfate/molybdate transport systems ATPase subunit
MDEPFSSLDSELRSAVRADFRRLQQDAQVTTVFVTHDREDAAALADEVVDMRDGRVAAGTYFPTGRHLT